VFAGLRLLAFALALTLAVRSGLGIGGLTTFASTVTGLRVVVHWLAGLTVHRVALRLRVARLLAVGAGLAFPGVLGAFGLAGLLVFALIGLRATFVAIFLGVGAGFL